MNAANLIGHTLDGKYQIERELGRGGMGAVYLATHLGTERAVALKVIAPEFMRREEFVERFRREARAAGRLRHPNVVDVTDFGLADTNLGRVAYLVMEYLDGCTLGEVLEEEKRLPLPWTLDILEQTCSAVAEAHRQGIIHRDLKPDNIWLEPNSRGGYTVKVLDFGIAKLEDHLEPHSGSKQIEPDLDLKNKTENRSLSFQPNLTAEFDENATLNLEAANLDEGSTMIFPAARATVAENSGTNQEAIATQILSASTVNDKRTISSNSTAALTRVGAVLGTPLYMSPEQCRGEKLDPRADIYSLGVIAYQMLSGAPPFSGNFTEVITAHQNMPAPPLEAKNVRRKVKKVIDAALAKSPDERPASALDFSSKLRASSEGVGTLFRRALVIYSEHLPAFIKLAALMAIPMCLASIGQVLASLLSVTGVIPKTIGLFIAGALGIVAPIINIFFAAIMTGVSTWLVAQHLAVPLRPIILRPAFQAARKHLKTFAGTVMAVSLLSIVGLFFCLAPGFVMFILFSLVTPVVMMESLRGRAAVRRSIELTKRSLKTVTAVTFVHLLVPLFFSIVITIVIGLVSNGASNIYSKVSTEINKSHVEKAQAETSEKADNSKETGTKITVGRGFSIEETGKTPNQDDNSAKVKEALRDGAFQLVWLPIAVFIGSFASVVTALLYMKTRQAGGESMQDLLAQFEETDRPKKRWQLRLKDKLVQSGRHTSRNT